MQTMFWDLKKLRANSKIIFLKFDKLAPCVLYMINITGIVNDRSTIGN